MTTLKNNKPLVNQKSFDEYVTNGAYQLNTELHKPSKHHPLDDDFIKYLKKLTDRAQVLKSVFRFQKDPVTKQRAVDLNLDVNYTQYPYVDWVIDTFYMKNHTYINHPSYYARAYAEFMSISMTVVGMFNALLQCPDSDTKKVSLMLDEDALFVLSSKDIKTAFKQGSFLGASEEFFNKLEFSKEIIGGNTSFVSIRYLKGNLDTLSKLLDDVLALVHSYSSEPILKCNKSK